MKIHQKIKEGIESFIGDTKIHKSIYTDMRRRICDLITPREAVKGEYFFPLWGAVAIIYDMTKQHDQLMKNIQLERVELHNQDINNFNEEIRAYNKENELNPMQFKELYSTNIKQNDQLISPEQMLTTSEYLTILVYQSGMLTNLGLLILGQN
tara:strand:+ start:1631 stop:2089 length:459 start_codon:yes stop_codon:yes gene_type:complete